MNSLKLSWKNIKFRLWRSGLAVLLMASGLSIVVVMDQAKTQIEKQFKSSLGQIDLVVGPKGSTTTLLMSTVYHIEDPLPANIREDRAKAVKLHPFIDKTIPITIGDNYEGYRIVGTSHDYFDLYDAELAEGRLWDNAMQMVVGSNVAEKFGLSIKSKPIAGGHGTGGESLEGAHDHAHDNAKYTIVGVLKPTGTVVDNLLLCDYRSSWIVHSGHDDHASIGLPFKEDLDTTKQALDSNVVDSNTVIEEKPEVVVEEHDHGHDHHDHHHHDNKPLDVDSVLASIPVEKREVTAYLLRYKKTPRAFYDVPKFITDRTPFTTAQPSVVTSKVQKMLDPGLQMASYIGMFILFISLISVFIALYSSIKDRGYEIALTRVLGASRIKVFSMIILEGLILSVLGYIATLIVSHVGLMIISGILERNLHYTFDAWNFSTFELGLLGVALIIGLISALIPAIKAYRTDISTTLSK
ncbi:MAG: ABC transporter permease [Flavobacteriales bacterium]|nr:ABC transporter permease [Flavobacteriales bacterium]